MDSTQNKEARLSSFIKTDVTAVLLLDDLIFAGIGSWVHVLNRESRELLCKLEVWKGQKIYGFKPSTDGCEMLVFGGKQVVVISVIKKSESDKQDVISIVLGPITCDDWLHAAVWINLQECALLTAHNVVQVWRKKSTCLIKKYRSANNSLLYSGLLVPLHDDVLVLAGTVFSEVIISFMANNEPLLFLKGHKGVIFSIFCDLEKQLIVTTSDDRSVRIWGPSSTVAQSSYSKRYWEEVTMVCKHEVYGHTARVMRSIITNHLIISIGEDSAICYWDLEGELLKKNLSHQNGCIWCLDADSKDLVTGGGDSAVILHPLTAVDHYNTNESLELNVGNPKKIAFTARNNVVFLKEEDELHYYDMELKLITCEHKLKHESTYKFFSISSCKQLLAVADMAGNLDVFTEICKGEPMLRNVINKKLNIGKILSLHWAGNRHLVICSDSGIISVIASKGNETEMSAKFVLPNCKERWLTAAATDSTNKIFVCGDRCGNLHVYISGQSNPVKTFSKVHGRYGPTSIRIKNSKMVTTGRDGTVKHFVITTNSMKFMNSTDLSFEWVEKFLDKDENVVCGFQERIFVAYDLRNNARLIEVSCGGGHRSWDAVRFIEKVEESYKAFIRLMYLKNSTINIATIELSKVISRNVLPGSHTKEINCLKSYTISEPSVTFFMSGGEDTTLRISSWKNEKNDVVYHDEAIFKHLSSVRTLQTCALTNNNIVLVTAGGRAQISIKVVEFKIVGNEIKLDTESVIDYQVKGTDKERKGNQTWRNGTVDFDPETRIMDVEIFKMNEVDFIVAAGCSDASLRMFKFEYKSEGSSFKPIVEIKYHKTCILKTASFKFKGKDILVTCTTRGDVTFWNLKDLIDRVNDTPIFETKTNKTGINSISVKVLSESDVIFATGGDDNAIHLNLLKITDFSKFENQSICEDNYHCSEITGLNFIDNNLLLSTSIDQRVTLSRWRTDENTASLQCEFISQTFTDVADVQGMDVLSNNSDHIKICIFGKGLQIINIPKNLVT